jgi:glycolate oxidase iron-sulfur subunit
VETHLASWIKDTPEGRKADEILRACVHCGFCLATCPTYQVLGDELDGPRGRIYQIKQVLEGEPATRATQIHLDRCLTCRSCETTCPSGVEYGHLLDIGRATVDAHVARPWPERASRWLLRESVTRPWLFGPVLRMARSLSWALPRSLRAKVGAQRPAGPWPANKHSRKVLLLKGCAQPAMSPSIDAATARVLDAIAIQAVVAPQGRCCGAIHQHLEDQSRARDFFRRNIDAWWPFIESASVEAIIVNASGCGAMVKEYAHHLRDDPAYAAKAARVVTLTRDPAEFLAAELHQIADRLGPPTPRRVAFHPPCTLQHGLKIRGTVEKMLTGLGAELVPVADAHLCCGSAGTYSLLQPQMARELRARKLEKLLEHEPQEVLSANIGCIAHLQSATAIPVRHWIEWIDGALRPHLGSS